MPVITIDRNDFVKGISTSNEMGDGGFSPNSKGIRLISADYTEDSQDLYGDATGLPKPQATSNDLSDNLENGKPITQMMTAQNTIATYSTIFVTDDGTNAGSFWGWANSLTTPPIKKLSDTTGTESYNSMMKTQMVWYDDATFVSTNTDIIKLARNLDSKVDNWWTSVGGAALESNHAHPMMIFDEKIYIGNEHSLASWDGSTATDAVLTLSEDSIISLGQDPSSGDMLIGTNSDFNADGSKRQISKIFVWDGFSPAPNREIIVEERVTSFYNIGGITYVFYGTNLGYWNGQGITHLRNLNISYKSDQLIYKGKVTDLNGTLYIVERRNILAYGSPIQGGNKVFYYPYRSSHDIGGIHNVGRASEDSQQRPQLALWWSDGSDNTVMRVFNPFDSTSDRADEFHTNKYYLPSNSRIKKVEVITEKLVSGDDIDISLYKSEDETFVSLGDMKFSVDGAITEKTFGRDKNIETSVIQARATWDGGATGIKQIKVYYDAIEKPI